MLSSDLGWQARHTPHSSSGLTQRAVLEGAMDRSGLVLLGVLATAVVFFATSHRAMSGWFWKRRAEELDRPLQAHLSPAQQSRVEPSQAQPGASTGTDHEDGGAKPQTDVTRTSPTRVKSLRVRAAPRALRQGETRGPYSTQRVHHFSRFFTRKSRRPMITTLQLK